MSLIRRTDTSQAAQDFLAVLALGIGPGAGSTADRKRPASPTQSPEVSSLVGPRLDQGLTAVASTAGLRLADWYSLYCYRVLQGMGELPDACISGTELEDGQRVARLWAGRLAESVCKAFQQWQLVRDFGEAMVKALEQTPDALLQVQLQTLLSPEYLRAQARRGHFFALYRNDRAGVEEAERILKATDKELAAEIDSWKRSGRLLQLCREVRELTHQVFKASVEQSQDIADAEVLEILTGLMGQVAFAIGMELRQALLSDRRRADAVLKVIKESREAEALDEEYRARNGWGGDRSKGVSLAFLASCGRNFVTKPPEYDSRSFEEREIEAAELEGAFLGLRDYAAGRPAALALAGALGGGFRSYLRSARRNKRADHLREENHWWGIRVPGKWYQEGLTEDEIRRRQKADLRLLKGRTLRDREIQLEKGGTTTLLELAEYREAERKYLGKASEEARLAFVQEKLDELCTQVKLTPRRRIVKENFDKSDAEVASLLSKRFGKEFSPESVRALRHDLLVKLREAARKK